jgi:hypothetical protein
MLGQKNRRQPELFVAASCGSFSRTTTFWSVSIEYWIFAGCVKMSRLSTTQTKVGPASIRKLQHA